MKKKIDLFRVFIRHNASSTIVEIAGRFTRVREQIYTDSAQESCGLLEKAFPCQGHGSRPVNAVPCVDLFGRDFLPLIVDAGSDEIRLAKAPSCEIADMLLCIHHPD